MYLNRCNNIDSKISTPIKPTYEMKIHERYYDLIAVGSHVGLDTNTGHYTVNRKVNNEWYLFNDSYVTKDTPNDDRNSYIVIYERNGEL